MLKRVAPAFDFDHDGLSIKRRRYCSPQDVSPFKEHPNENTVATNYTFSSPHGKKRLRTSGSCREELMYNHQADLEIKKIQHEFEHFKHEAEKGIIQVRNENQELMQRLNNINTEKERLEQENKLLKNAVMTLNNKREETSKQQQAAMQAIQLLQNKVKHLEQKNFTLGMHLQQATCRQDGKPWDQGPGNGDIY